ncbi:MAG: hypothetical protein R3D56_03385 [Paracoccaceae bacterium]
MAGIDYNATLGPAYLAGLVEEFGTSPLLVATGYNAYFAGHANGSRASATPRQRGRPGRLDRGDPFRETQTHVMRVAESLPIYRARLTGRQARRFHRAFEGALVMRVPNA